MRSREIVEQEIYVCTIHTCIVLYITYILVLYPYAYRLVTSAMALGANPHTDMKKKTSVSFSTNVLPWESCVLTVFNWI